MGEGGEGEGGEGGGGDGDASTSTSTNPEQPPHWTGNSLRPTRAQASTAFSGQPAQFVAFQEVMRKVMRSPHL